MRNLIASLFPLPVRETMKVRVRVQRAILRAIHDSASAPSYSFLLHRRRVRVEDKFAARLSDAPQPLKRQATATYHNASKKYLTLHLAEFSFRFNNRNNPDIFGIAVSGS